MKFQHPEAGVIELNPQTEADIAALVAQGVVPIEEKSEAVTEEPKPTRKQRRG